METIELELSRIFVKVVQQGGFSKAAELLKIPKSTVSKSVTKLESLTGTKLLLRTTRSHSLTAAGRLFYETCLEPIQVLEDAQRSLLGQDTIVSGNIKLTAPEDLGTYVIAPILGSICQAYPKVSFEMQYTNEIVDLVKDGFDLAIRLGAPKESQLKLKPIGQIELIPVASPKYLEKHKPISSPEDIKNHECLGLSHSTMSRFWVLKNNKRRVKIPIHHRIECNQMTSLVQVAKAGAGLLLAPNFLCRPEIETGSLKRILKGWTGVGIPVNMLSPVSISATARLRVVSEQIASTIKKELEKRL